MAVPEQIRKQSEAVEELYKQLGESDNTGESQDSTDDNTLSNDTAADETTVSSTATSLPTNEQSPASDSTSEEAIAQKYRTLQGMYNAEVPRLHQQNREMTQRVQQMEQLLASLSTKQQAAAPQQQQPSNKLVTEKDIDDYGDSIDMMRKVSREEMFSMSQRVAQLEAVLQQMQAKVVPQVQAVAQRQQVNAEQQFWSDLAKAVPNFREINDNGSFQSWLLQADPLTGITRQTYLDDAQRSLDSRRVANFFHTWLQNTGQANVAQPTGRSSSSELEKQVAPGRSRGSNASPGTNKAKIYTPQDIQKFFNDVRAGKYKGREQDRDRIERDIFAAQRDNRIQLNA